MPQPKFQLYKHIKISGKWRYCRAAIYSNGKVKPHVVVVSGQEEKHEEGSYCIRATKNLGSKLAPTPWKLSGCAASSLTKPNTLRCSRYSNKVGYVAVFLKEFGVSRLLKKTEYPRYHKKKVAGPPGR
jgi:hypothetical protein